MADGCMVRCKAESTALKTPPASLDWGRPLEGSQLEFLTKRVPLDEASNERANDNR